MSLCLRCHVPMTAAMESVAVAGQRRGGPASRAEARSAARGMRAGATIIQGLGYPIYPRPKAAFYFLPTFLSAFLLRMLSRSAAFRNGLGECRALIDVMRTAAANANANPPAPDAAETVLAMKPAAS